MSAHYAEHIVIISKLNNLIETHARRVHPSRIMQTQTHTHAHTRANTHTHTEENRNPLAQFSKATLDTHLPPPPQPTSRCECVQHATNPSIIHRHTLTNTYTHTLTYTIYLCYVYLYAVYGMLLFTCDSSDGQPRRGNVNISIRARVHIAHAAYTSHHITHMYTHKHTHMPQLISIIRHE